MADNTINIYVLALDQGKYYIGRTRLPVERINEHFNGSGSGWTKKYTPRYIIEFRTDASPFDEDKITKEYMAKYGLDNVRGGSYCQLELPREERLLLEKEIRSAKGQCFKCGKQGHVQAKCKQKTMKKIGQCFKCGREGHWIADCYAKTDIHGKKL